MADKIIVQHIESERGWGQKVDKEIPFDTLEEAQAHIIDFNSKNTDDVVPDWYMYAKLKS